MVLPVHSVKSAEWVAFAGENEDDGFEAVVTTSRQPSSSSRPPSRGGSSTRRVAADALSVSTWMKRPVSADKSIAPLAPPRSHKAKPDSEHPVANKHRPPRNRASSLADGSVNQSNPVSSSDDSSSSENRASPRGRGVQRTHSAARARSSSRARDVVLVTSPKAESRRSRSRSRDLSTEVREGPVVDMESNRGRKRSTSKGASSLAGEHSNTSHPPRIATRSASLSRPPTTPVRRARSTSRNPPAAKVPSDSRTRSMRPPSTSRTRRQQIIITSSSNSVGPGVSPMSREGGSNRSVVSESAYSRTRDDNIGRNISFGLIPPTAEGIGRSRTPMLSSPTTASISSGPWKQPDQIHSRILLTATVYHNTATNLWIATINTNQKGVAKNPAMASKYLKAFSFASENEARESAIANAPPKMLPFTEHPNCQSCNSKFSLFRRASHCRNCGVCVCTTCSTVWPAKMIPDTYNLKKEANVRVCKSCTHLSAGFKKALLDGNYEKAVAVYGTGNVNLRTPFPQMSKKKEETMYPIHCAVSGGNIDIVRWLIEDHFCPIKVVLTGSTKPKRGGSSEQLILTSSSRSVLTIAMEGLHVDILRYLVVENNVSIYSTKDLKSSLRALEAVLLALPAVKGQRRIHTIDPRWDQDSFDEHSFASSMDGDITMGGETRASRASRASSKKPTSSDHCILCYENAIDCVMTPCGHQVSCLKCSKNLKVCPVCSGEGEFIKIFRP